MHAANHNRHASLLKGTNVAEVGTSIAVAAAGRILAQLGANVTTFALNLRASGVPSYFESGKVKKQWMWADDAVRTLGEFDIVLDDHQPVGEGLRWRELLRTLTDRHPQVVQTTITPFGLEGPYATRPASDAMLSALSGLANLTPRDIPMIDDGGDQPPLAMPGHLVQNYAAIAAASGTLAAVYSRLSSGGGQHVDVSILETLLPTIRREIALYTYEDIAATRFMRVWKLAPWGVKRCLDGYVFVQVVEEHHWSSLVDMIGSPEWANDPALLVSAERYERRYEIEACLLDWLADKAKLDVVTEAQERGIPFAVVSTPLDMIDLPQVKHRQFVEKTANGIQLSLPFIMEGAS